MTGGPTQEPINDGTSSSTISVDVVLPSDHSIIEVVTIPETCTDDVMKQKVDNQQSFVAATDNFDLWGGLCLGNCYKKSSNTLWMRKVPYLFCAGTLI